MITRARVAALAASAAVLTLGTSSAASVDAGTLEVVLSDGGVAVRMGSLDKEAIRQVIHRNRESIRYCYEKELTHSPDLKGKISVRFQIASTGVVDHASVFASTAANKALEDCLVGQLGLWVFPPPKGGGIVIVTYPFVFNTAPDAGSADAGAPAIR